MSAAFSSSERMLTGMPGLDQLLTGGIVRGNSLLVEGPPGSGKSTLAVRILHEGIVQFQEPALLITFEEFPRQIYQEALAYGLDLKAHENSGLLRIVWTPPTRVLEGFSGKNDLIDKVVEEMGVRRLVIDSITHFRRVADSEAEMREVLAQILSYLKIKGVNAILVRELERQDDTNIAFEEYLVDASMRLYNTASTRGGENVRYLEVRKTRGQAHISGKHPFRLGASGFTVYPRLRARGDSSNGEESNGNSRLSFGIPEVDQMLYGGLWRRTVNLIQGTPGAGKSVLGFHFLHEGIRAGERVLLLSFKNPPEEVVRQAETLGLDWHEAWETGRLQILHFHPVDLLIEEITFLLTEQLSAGDVNRFVMDSVSDLVPAMGAGGRLKDYIHLLGALLHDFGTTSVLTYGARHLGGASISEDSHDLYYLASTVLQLSIAESDGELRRFLGVLKHSGSNHAKELRAFSIDESGFHVEQKASGLSGILTGQTRGALKQVSNEVMPLLEEVTELLAAVATDGTVDPATRERVQNALNNIGLSDILLREHFGLTEFQKLAEEH